MGEMKNSIPLFTTPCVRSQFEICHDKTITKEHGGSDFGKDLCNGRHLGFLPEAHEVS